MTSTNDGNKVLIIGGHGNVALLTAPRLVEKGASVTSLIRDPKQSSDIESAGATPLVRDITEVSPESWDELLAEYDTVIWSAGAGGKGGAEATYAIDRDAALEVIASLRRLGDKAPRLLLVSFIGSRENLFSEDDGMYDYGEAKRVVDEKLDEEDSFEHIVIAPTMLTNEDVDGFEEIQDEKAFARDKTTSRKLVAAVLTELATRESWPKIKRFAFIDGDKAVSEIPA